MKRLEDFMEANARSAGKLKSPARRKLSETRGGFESVRQGRLSVIRE